VTHGIGFLPQCDRVLSLEGGRIQEMGTYAALIDNDGPFAEFIRTHTGTEVEEGVPGQNGTVTSCIFIPLDKGRERDWKR